MAPLLAPLLAACGTGSVGVNGWDMRDFFPFDGTRSWEFTNTDASMSQLLVATMDGVATDQGDGLQTYDVRYELFCIDPEDTDCVNTWVRTLTWSADRTNGIGIHRVTAPDFEHSFEPPVTLAEPAMVVGATVSEGGYTSSFSDIVPCPILWTDEWDQCVHLVLEGEGPGSEHIVGEYWATATYGVVALGLDADAGDWQLSYATFVE